MNYGFLGCGNMGGAIARALHKSGAGLTLLSKSGTRAQALARELGCACTQDPAQLADCQVLVLAVKPQVMAQALTPLVPAIQRVKPLIISMAAGLSLAQIEEMAGGSLPVIRIMPNTPVAIGQGMTTYCHNSMVTEQQLSAFLADFAPSGLVEAIPEVLMDAASAAAGCSPAYAYMFIEAMADGAVSCGLPRAQALQFSAAAVAGAAQLLLATGEHPGTLKDAVCSPGGSTIAGVRALEEAGFRGAVMDAIRAAWLRSQELGK